MSEATTPRRADLFRYVDLEVNDTTLRATYELDGRVFVETIDFEGVGPLTTRAGRAVAELWFLLAGLSYFKAGAARRVDVGSTALGEAGARLLKASIRDGLAEFAYRNDVPLDDVTIVGGARVQEAAVTLDAHRVLVPFGGGID
ncbi:MAG: hypothetical protein WCF63_04920, partial [Acidimicrobiales bacterium]